MGRVIMGDGAEVSRLPFGMTGKEPVFERVSALASALFGRVWVSIVIFSEHGVWRSVDPENRLIGGTPFADPVVASGEPVWWPDLAAEPDLANYALVAGPPFLRFAAGAPIRTGDGVVHGAVTVAGPEPRASDPVLIANLSNLAALVADECERAWTAQRLREQFAARRTEQLIQRAFASTLPASVVMMDRDLRIIQASKRFLDSVPATPDELYGRLATEVSPEYFQRFLPFLERSLQGETIVEERLRVRGPSGGKIWLRAEVSPWFDADGQVGGVISCTTNVSDLVEALERSERSEQRLNLAAEIAKLQVWELDYARGQVHLAGAPEAVFDQEFTFEDLAADTNITIDPRDRERIADEWREAVENDRPYFPEYRVVRRDNAEVWAASAVKLVRNSQGQPIRMIGAMLNVTDRKRAELDLVQAKEEAEAANNAKSAFLATMSHEIRTPLNGVLGMAQVMAAEELSPEQRERLDIIRQSGESLLAILNDVLDLSKIEAGKLELEDIDFDLDEIARGAHAAFQGVAEGKGVAFQLEIDPSAIGAYRGDSTRLRQVLYNLVSNALKFTEVGEVRVDICRPADHLVIAVSDTGVGIASDRLDRLFDKFEQADASTTRRFGGTGLGLAICRELVQLMGGEIAVHSQVGEGTTFTVRLPLPYLGEGALPASAAASAAAPEDAEELRVLVAEDNPVNQQVLTAILRQAGVSPVVVADGAEAVAQWRDGAWDVILMDVQMPTMDGPTATRQIRAEEAATGRRRTPIIALTANAMAHQVAEYAQAGMDDFVAKPLQVTALFAALDRVLTEPEPEVLACA